MTRYEDGLKIRKEVLGDTYVENILRGVTDFDRELQEIITEYCWGLIWNKNAIPRKYKSLINVALLAALGKSNELRIHVKGAIRNGCSKEEIKEALLQAMIYAGVPVGVEGFRIAREAIREMEEEGWHV
ncbi:MAG: carboxymuconolactone decarboxylase family protein [Candidatus Methanomethylicia archaeon]